LRRESEGLEEIIDDADRGMERFAVLGGQNGDLVR
jgi:hypothetical protein